MKDVLDHALVGERLLQADYGNHYRLLSREEGIRLICQSDPVQVARMLADEPCRIWDEGAGIFVREGERQPLLGDGSHRHGQ